MKRFLPVFAALLLAAADARAALPAAVRLKIVSAVRAVRADLGGARSAAGISQERLLRKEAFAVLALLRSPAPDLAAVAASLRVLETEGAAIPGLDLEALRQARSAAQEALTESQLRRVDALVEGVVSRWRSGWPGLAPVERDAVVDSRAAEPEAILTPARVRVVSRWASQSRIIPASNLSPDGRLIAAYKGDGELSILDVERGRAIAAIKRPRERIWSAALGKGDRLAIVGSKVALWDLRASKLVGTYAPEPFFEPSRAVFSPDGRLLAVASKSYVRILGGRSGRRRGRDMRVSRLSSPIDSITFLPAGDAVMVRDHDFNRAEVLDIRSGETLAELGVEELAFSRGGRGVVTALDYDVYWTVTDSDIKTGATVTLAKIKPDGRTLRLSPDGRFAYSSTYGGLSLWDAATGERLARLAVGEAALPAIRFTPDGRRLVHIGDDVVTVVDLR